MKPKEGYFDFVSLWSYRYSTFVVGPTIFFPIFLKLMLTLPGDDRRPVL